ncbi:hypothetical protein FUA23_08855 [Neolewinella aurantiaca]|uniref:Lipocalin-like domain-containing protein n=1 Tax=Neolewinella aurantiaca TaxID=2602767 RepID=A0A5C7FH80_9BACT|nr:hypothetical protein [Neolewinella aurantiaca]TXF89786.1 hypothetical protein FUA23_08855 [Neolewinella aurantiaca]
MMRQILLASLLTLLFLPVSAQRGRGPALDGVWLETSLDRYGQPLPVERQPKRTTLFLEPDGYFEEIRPGTNRYADDRRFIGRWDADYRLGHLTLTVDAPRRVSASPYRYNRGSRRAYSQRIPYTIVFSDRDELVLRDRRDGRKRFFVRE